MSTRLASISVDVDSLHHYLRIHGNAAADRDPTVWRAAMPRFQELFRAQSVKATFFVVGEEASANSAMLRALAAAGHEIANHSHRHLYDLWRQPAAVQRDEIARAHDAIATATGVAPVGFRAPGYSVSESLLDAVRAEGYRYDSSVFPAAPYYFAKAAVIASQKLRPVGSSLGPAKVLVAPRHAYFPHPQDWRRRALAGSVVELPIPVVPPFAFPYIGTTILTTPRPVFQWLTDAVCARYDFVNVELHGIELLDFAADSVDARLRNQPDLKRPLAAKRERLIELFARLREKGFEIVTVAEAASRVAIG
jgi:peptidoglycan/xylan/chitin deacetylase (PgdA/CDA1 family)